MASICLARASETSSVTPHSAVLLIAAGCALEYQPSHVVDSRVVYPPSREGVS
jgi:hypothetical protein